MSRPVYYFDSENIIYTFVKKAFAPEPCVLEFLASTKDLVKLRQRRSLLSTSKGLLAFSVRKVTRLPGPLVGGMHPLRVEMLKM